SQCTLSNPNPNDNRFNRGLSDYDLTHNFRLSTVLNAPAMSGAPLPMRLLAGGWTVSSILDVHSGLPFGISSGRDNSFTAIGLDRADLLRNPALSSDRPQAARLAMYFDPAAVTCHATPPFGNS